MTEPTVTPLTEAGKRLLHDFEFSDVRLFEVRAAILAVEAEALGAPEPSQPYSARPSSTPRSRPCSSSRALLAALSKEEPK